MKKKIKQAFILAAGLGTRLRPITNTIPKQMVPIDEHGKPLLEHTIEHLRDQGITDFIINLHYLSDVITSYFGDGSKLGVRMRYSDESQKLLETAGAIKKAEPMLDDDFIFMYGDELHFLDFTPFIDFHLEHHALATIILKKTDDPLAAELAEFDPTTNKIIAWYTRPHAIAACNTNLLANSGLYVLSKAIASYIPKGRPIKLDGEVIPVALAAKALLYALPTDEQILDIGKIEKYEHAKKYYQEKRAA